MPSESYGIDTTCPRPLSSHFMDEEAKTQRDSSNLVQLMDTVTDERECEQKSTNAVFYIFHYITASLF